MKKSINGVTYNTDTATIIYEYFNGLPKSNLNYVYEVLYETKKGENFLYYDGGAQSDYCVSTGDVYQHPDKGIIPIDPVDYWNRISVESLKKFKDKDMDDFFRKFTERIREQHLQH